MKNNIAFIFLIYLSCCGEIRDKEIASETKDEDLSHNEIIEDQDNYIDSLALSFNPIDLLKKIERPLNSGVVKQNEYFYHVDTIGYYYNSYDVLDTIQVINEENGSVIKDSETRVKFSITTFNFAKNTDHFYNQNAILIELYSEIKDNNLGDLDLVGKNVEKVSSHFKSFRKKDGFYIFNTKEIILICEVDQKSRLIRSFNLLRINESAMVHKISNKMIAAHNHKK